MMVLHGLAIADIVRFTDGRVQNDLEITVINGGLQPNLAIRPRGESRFEVQPLDVLQYIEFREPGDLGRPPVGRTVHLTMLDGTVITHQSLESMDRGPHGWTLRMRKATDVPGTDTRGVALVEIGQAALAPIPPPRTRGEAVGKVTTARRRGELGRLSDTPPPPPPPGAAPAPGPNAPQTDTEYIDQITGISAVYGDRSPLREEEPKKGMFDIGGASTGADIEKLGMMVILIAAGVMMLVTFFVGTFMLMFSAKSQGINDLTVPRAIATSALLAFVPPGLFLICLLLPIPLCSIKITAGIFAFWFTSKVIVAGMLEVMEGKATGVLINFYLTLLLLVCGAWLYVQHMM